MLHLSEEPLPGPQTDNHQRYLSPFNFHLLQMGCRGDSETSSESRGEAAIKDMAPSGGAKRDVGNSNVPTGANADGRIGIIQGKRARGQFIGFECEKFLTSLGLHVPHRCQITCCTPAQLYLHVIYTQNRNTGAKEQWRCQNTMCLIKPQIPRQDGLIDTGWCTKSSGVSTSCWSAEWCDKHADVCMSPGSSEVNRGERAWSKGLKLKVGFGNSAGLLMSRLLVEVFPQHKHWEKACSQ